MNLLNIEDYYIDSGTAGVMTALEKPEAVDMVHTIFYTAFGMNWSGSKLEIELHHIHEELALYKPADTIENIRKIRVQYDGHTILISKLIADVKTLLDNITFAVYNPVIGCPNGCTYCYTQKLNDKFGFIDNWHEPKFRGMYSLTKDADGNDIPELFTERPKNGKPIGWMLTYLSDCGCWNPAWQQNVMEQIVAAVNFRKRQGSHPDTFTLLTKKPSGIDLSFIPDGTKLPEVCVGVTVDRNGNTFRIKELIDRLKHFKPSVMVSYSPVLEKIEPKYLDELAAAFGAKNCYVYLCGELLDDNSTKPTPFEWLKDIVDKCIELGIPYAYHFTLKETVEAAGYEYKPQQTSVERYDRAMSRSE